MPTWSKLPAEIRQRILACIGEGHDRPPKPLGRGAFASVCREWQEGLEPYIFRHLVLRPSRLISFERIAEGPRGMLRLTYLSQVFFLIDLPTSDCFGCDRIEERWDINKNQAKLTESLWKFLEILSLWTVGEWEALMKSNPAVYGLKKLSNLELFVGAYSPSDCEHKVNEFRFHKEYNFWFDSEISFKPMYDEYMAKNPVPASGDHWQPKHDDVENLEQVLRGVDSPFRMRSRRLTNLEFNFRAIPPHIKYMHDDRDMPYVPPFVPIKGFESGFPVAEKVTSLFIPRHFLWSIRDLSFGRLCKRSFPRLQRLAYERWLDAGYSPGANERRPEFGPVLKNGLPKSLEVLNLFEDYNRIYPFDMTAAAGSRYRPLHFDYYLAQAMLQGSKNLRELTACFIFDAAEFFHRFLPLQINRQPNVLKTERPWDRLEVLTLTADCFTDIDHKFHYRENGDENDEVLVRTATFFADVDHNDVNEDEVDTSRISQVLLAAGRAASLMPKLKLMEIWDSSSNIARIFRYEVKDEANATMTWISNLDEPVGPLGSHPEILSVWSAAAGGRNVEIEESPRIMTTRTKPVQADAGTWIHYIEVLPYLRSRDRLLLPLSRAQVQLERETDLANDNPSTRLVDPLTWDVIDVIPRSAPPSDQARFWQLCFPPSTRTSTLEEDDNAVVRLSIFEESGDARMLHP